MSVHASPAVTAPGASRNVAFAALVRADAGRFARHPLFLSGVAVLVVMLVVGIARRSVVDVAVMEGLVLPEFFLGVFGFVVAHRLTSALRRSSDLVDTVATGPQRRTLSLCLACLVPTAVAAVTVVLVVIFGAVWPPHGIPAGQPVAWFGHEPTLDIVATLIAAVPLSVLGGSLLGVAVARWLPFRGSALLGVVVLVIGAAYGDALPAPWFTVSPWFNFGDSLVVDGQMRSSWLRDGVEPLWSCAYYASLCGLAVVAALLRDAASRRPLVTAGAGLAVLAVVCVLVPAA